HLLSKDPAHALATLRSLGVDVVRVILSWREMAPHPLSRHKPSGFHSSNPASYPASTWGPIDRLVKDAKAAGIGLQFDLTGGERARRRAERVATGGARNHVGRERAGRVPRPARRDLEPAPRDRARARHDPVRGGCAARRRTVGAVRPDEPAAFRPNALLRRRS